MIQHLLLLILGAQGDARPLEWFRSESDVGYGYFGSVLAAAGDVDADGIEDLIASDRGEYAYGQPLIRILSGLDGSVIREVFAPGVGWTNNFGKQLAGGGDWNGDGHAEVLIFDPSFVSGGLPGAVLVVSGADGTELTRVLPPAADGAISLGEVGDLNLDGIPDFGLGGDPASGANGRVHPGCVNFYAGGTAALIHRVEGFHSNSEFGFSMAPVDDINANPDGIPDVLVGSPGLSASSGYSNGAVYAISGATGGLLRTFRSRRTELDVGTAIAAAGDVNGDGRPDVLCGDLDGEIFGSHCGAVIVFSGADSSELLGLDGPEYGAEFGAAVDGGSDWDGDGLADLLISAPDLWHQDGYEAGAVFVYRQSGELIATIWGSPTYVRGGEQAVFISDLTGDARSDVAFGVPSDHSASSRKGAVNVYGAHPWLLLDPPIGSTASAELLVLRAELPAQHAGWSYRVLASLGPRGSFQYGVNIPVQPDRLARQFATLHYPPDLAHAGLSGVFDANGEAIAFLAIPSLLMANMAGRSLFFCIVAMPPGASLPAVASGGVEWRIR